jgi:hypothetical protein
MISQRFVDQSTAHRDGIDQIVGKRRDVNRWRVDRWRVESSSFSNSLRSPHALQLKMAIAVDLAGWFHRLTCKAYVELSSQLMKREEAKINTYYMLVIFMAAVALLTMVTQVAAHVNSMITPVLYAM